MQILDVVDDLRLTCADGITAVAGIVAVEGVKDDNILIMIFKISLHHGQLIEICEQGKVQCTHVCLEPKFRSFPVLRLELL